MGYSPERKAAVLKRMLPPNNLPVRGLSQEKGISKATLHKWRAQARGKGRLIPHHPGAGILPGNPEHPFARNGHNARDQQHQQRFRADRH